MELIERAKRMAQDARQGATMGHANEQHKLAARLEGAADVIELLIAEIERPWLTEKGAPPVEVAQ